MTETIQLRQGTTQDCPEVLTLMQAAFAEYKDWLVPRSGVFSETVESLEAHLEVNTLLVAFTRQAITERLVGSIFYVVQENGEMYFGRLAVLPQYRGQGVGRRLISQVETLAQQRQCASVTLGVRIALDKNVCYFHSLGYREVSRHTHSGFEQPTYIKMAKSVDAA